MKSYFAKLAARATQANVPASSAVQATKGSDPFAHTSPPTEGAESIRVTSETRGFAPSPPSQVTGPESAVPHSITNEISQAEAIAHATTLAPNPLPNFPSTLRGPESEPRSQEPKSRHTTRMDPPIRPANSSSLDALEPLQRPESATVQTPAHKFDETAKRPENGAAHDDLQRLAHIEAEQSILLRKADDFMQRLTEHRRPTATNPESDAAPKSSEILTTNNQPDESPRLQPTRVVDRLPEREAARPSVVIGKLTVEVMPPSPPPTAAGQQVVVVHGARRGGNDIRSSRRFGLGQF